MCWVQCVGRTHTGVGGAEFSNNQVIQAGREMGYDVRVVTEEDRDKKQKKGFNGRAKKLLTQAEFVVMNDTNAFDQLQWEQLLVLFFENNQRYVRYEHDYGFCRRRTSLNCGGERNTCKRFDCNTPEELKQEAIEKGIGYCWERTIDLFRHIFQGSILNIFISPQQKDIHQKALGDVVKPYWYLPPPLDVNHCT